MSFIKWAGGKAQLLQQLSDLLPPLKNIKGYAEPFLGGGSMFFYIENQGLLNNIPVQLSDVNSGLVTTYRVVRDNLPELIDELDAYYKLHNEEFYYNIRDNFHKQTNSLKIATQFIYLNKTCFNGMWRVNSDGVNNQSIGHKEKVQFYDRVTIEKCSKALKSARIRNLSFEEAIELCTKDYFVYCCLPETKIRMMDERLLNIENVSVDDKVFAGGNVLSTICREYNGNVYEFELMGIYDNLHVTEEHPLLVIKNIDFYKYRHEKWNQIKNQHELNNLEIHWVESKNIEVGDFLLNPCYPENILNIKNIKIGDKNIECNEEFGWILGFWLAEGHIERYYGKYCLNINEIKDIKEGKQKSMFNYSDLNIEKINELINNIYKKNEHESSYILTYSCGELDFTCGFIDKLNKWYNNYFNVNSYTSSNLTKTSYQIKFIVKALAKFIHDNFGEYAENKKINKEMLNYPIEFQKGLLRGWLDGDGGIWKDKNNNKIKITGTTISKQLALDMYSISLRLGLRPSLKHRGKEEKRMIMDKECHANVAWDVYFSSSNDIRYIYPEHFVDENREDNDEMPTKGNLRNTTSKNSKERTKRKIITKGNLKFILTPITNILKREYHGKVYNLTTEHHVYVTNYVLSHNCDPPYDNIGEENNASFVGYTADSFKSKRPYLLDTFRKLDEIGCKVMMSNSATPWIMSQFKDYNITIIKAKRICAGKTEDRVPVDEVVITNYKPPKKQYSLMEF